MKTGIEFTRANNDANGNPRYICHFTHLLKEDQKGYETALKNAKQFGGRKFNNKQYGGGIIFQSYNIYDLSKKIEQFNGTYKKYRLELYGNIVFESDDILALEAYKNTLQPIEVRERARINEY